MTVWIRKYLFCFVFFFFCAKIFAQIEKEKELSFTLRSGYGIQYLGLGGNAEIHLNNYALYYSVGRMDKLKIENSLFNVPATINHAAGIRYYIYDRKIKDSHFLRPSVGIHVGWVNKYWDSRITDINYNYNLYGVAFHGNLQVDFKYFLLDFGLGIVPEFTIFSKSQHPYTSNLYWSPSIGLGFNFSNIKRLKKENYNKKYDVNLNASLVKKMKLKVRRNYKRGACGNTILYQQTDSSRFLIVKINPDGANLSYDLRTIYFDTINKNIEVYLISKKISNDTSCCKLFNNWDLYKNYIVGKAVKGSADIIINQKRLEKDNRDIYRISAELYDVEFIRTKNDGIPELFKYDEIILWDITNSCFCK